MSAAGASKNPALVTFIGVGLMGGAMAANLLARGWGVEVCDLDPCRVQSLQQAGATVVPTPSHAAAGSEAVIICVVDAAQTAEVLFGAGGLQASLRPGQTVLLCPTIAPQDTEEFVRRLAARGIHAIDAPMSGGPARAREGSMSLMLACSPDLLQQHALLLAALASQIFHISDKPGDAARTKLVNNLLAGINLVGAAEALALARRLGLDLSTTLNVIEQSSGQSWIGSDRMRRAVAGDYQPRARVTLLEKDMRLALELARKAGGEGPLAAPASELFRQAHEAGLAELDDAVVFQLLVGRANQAAR